MPRSKPGPYKWAIFYTHTPLLLGMRGKEWINLHTFIYGWWGLDAWCDREYCALYDSKEEAEKDAAWLREHEDFKDCTFVAPTLRRFGEEKIVSVIRAEEARKEAQRKEDDARFEKWYLGEKARLDAHFEATRRINEGKKEEVHDGQDRVRPHRAH